MKKTIFLALGLMVLGAAAFGFYLFNKPHQSIASDKPDFQMKSSAIIGEFENDENSANKKFNGKQRNNKCHHITNSQLFYFVGCEASLIFIIF